MQSDKEMCSVNKMKNILKNIFLEKSYTECGGETNPRPISKKSKLNISLDQ